MKTNGSILGSDVRGVLYGVYELLGSGRLPGPGAALMSKPAPSSFTEKESTSFVSVPPCCFIYHSVNVHLIGINSIR